MALQKVERDRDVTLLLDTAGLHKRKATKRRSESNRPRFHRKIVRAK
jgi:hypothetical protein